MADLSKASAFPVAHDLKVPVVTPGPAVAWSPNYPPPAKGLRTGWFLNTVLVTTAGGLIIPQNPRRIVLILPVPPTNRYSISPGTVAPVLDQGAFNVPPGTASKDLWKSYYGCALEREWSAISAIANQILTFAEAVEVAG
jgi:hypothetical protein